MTGKGNGDTGIEPLDDLLGAARLEALPPPLQARMIAEAYAVQAKIQKAHAANGETVAVSGIVPRQPFAVRLREGLGGWGSMGGLVAAGLAGVWLGVAPPAIAGDPIGRFIEARQGIDIFDPDNVTELSQEGGQP